MARRAAIDQFAEKLRLALGRANLSRTALAQRVGVDKSVVARCSSGALHPADHSLAALSAALAQAIPGFDATAWDLPLEGFAARLGIAAPAAPPPPSPHDLLAPLLHGADQGTAAVAYPGLWASVFASTRGLGRLLCFAMRIRAMEGAQALGVEVGDLETVLWRGSLIAFGAKLYLARQTTHRDDAVAFSVLTGVDRGRAVILEGLTVTRDGGAEAAPAAVPILLLRLADRVDDAAFDAARRLAAERNRQGGWEAVLSEAALERFHHPVPKPPAPVILRRPMADCWATREADLGDPGMADRRATIETVRAVFATAIALPD
jgi:hypothetical protein